MGLIITQMIRDPRGIAAMPKFKLIMENWRKFKKAATSQGLKEGFDVDPGREEEERRFKAGEDNPWKQGPTLDSDELRDMADKMDQSQPGSAGSQFTRQQEKQMSDDIEEFMKKINRSIGLSEKELFKLNRVMDGLWDGDLPQGEIPGIAKALENGDEGLIDYFKIEMS